MGTENVFPDVKTEDKDSSFMLIDAEKVREHPSQYDNHGTQIKNFREYRYRYMVLLCFALASFANYFGRNICSSVQKELKQAYNQSTIVINFPSMMYDFLYPVSNLLGAFMIDKYGLRSGVSVGCLLTALGGIARFFVNFSFYYMILGHVLFSLASPFILNGITKLSVDWFYPKNRQYVTAVNGVVVSLSGVVGLVLSPIFVEQNLKDLDGIRNSFLELIAVEAGIIIVVCLFVVIFFRSKPPSAPSYAASHKKKDFKKGMVILIKNRNFLLLMIGMSFLEGAARGVGVNLENILDPWGIGAKFLILLVPLGMLASLIAVMFFNRLTKKTHQYRRIVFFLGGLSVAFNMMSLGVYSLESDYITLIVFILNFFPPLAVPAIAYEFACELTYPVGEALTLGIFISFLNLTSFFHELIQSGILSNVTRMTSRICGIYCIVCSIIATILFYFVEEDLKRTKKERSKSVESDLIFDE